MHESTEVPPDNRSHTHQDRCTCRGGRDVRLFDAPVD